MSFPTPTAQPLVGHLGRWGTAPLALLEEGALLGPVFGLRLWRRAVVGSSPDWNRFVLGDLDTFRSRGSLSGLSPYLKGGVVRSDLPAHRGQRSHLNPAFHRRAIAQLSAELAAGLVAPVGTFEAAAWSATTTRTLLARAFFGDRFPSALLEDFLAPLDTPPPGPFLPRRRLFARMKSELTASLLGARDGTLAFVFATMSDGVEQARVALAAAYDTTAHTMAWLLWHLADQPRRTAEEIANTVSETLRLYPSGWLGSRVAVRDVTFAGVPITAGTLVFYSPYLTHRDPTLWKDALTFRPERFRDPLPAWGYLPFSAGARTCLGASLATLILRTVGQAVTGSLARIDGVEQVRAGLTLAPAGPLLLRATPCLP